MNIEEMVKNGCIVFLKNGKIDIEEVPEFGEITLYFQDGKFTHLKKTETKK